MIIEIHTPSTHEEKVLNPIMTFVLVKVMTKVLVTSTGEVFYDNDNIHRKHEIRAYARE